ncbi:DUF6126 family protein [Streptomyces sp. NPDC091266]|uniref:DUF6126 family protein n=1 Tax=Streptomyces sp. NPDC091266 TaxID=3365978 RepID=UPI0037F4C30A
MPDQHSPSGPPSVPPPAAPPGAAPEPPRPDSPLDSRSGPGSASGPAPGSVPERTPARKYVENKPPRGLYVRVFIYVIATHVLLAFMSLLVVIAKTR